MTPRRGRTLLLLAALAILGLAWWRQSQRALHETTEPATSAPSTAPTADGAYPGMAPDEPLAQIPLVGGVSDEEPAPIGERQGVFRLLTRESPARDPAKLARELGRLGDEAKERAPAPQVGDVAPFWLHDIARSEYLQVQARLVVVTDHAYGWLQEGQTVDEAALTQGVQAFSDEVYGRVREAFGEEWSPGIDGDERVYILHHQPVDGVAGYFYSVDEQPVSVDAHSNAREMFYINLSAFTPGTPDYLALLAHEFQHMIHWNHDKSESVWINEGLSDLAPHLAGVGAQSGRLFMGQPDTPLLEWTSEPGANGPHYAAAFTFMAYLRQRFGDGVLRAIVAEEGDGLPGLVRAVAKVAPSDEAMAFEDLFLDWVVANIVPEDMAMRVATRYRHYPAVSLRMEAEAPGPYPGPGAGGGDETADNVGPYATDYWDATSYVRDGSLKVEFLGDDEVQLLVPNTGPEGHVVEEAVLWSGRGENIASGLTIPWSVKDLYSAKLTTWIWYELEEDWDYGYLQASTDGGETWRTLRLEGSREDDPNGNNLGLGVTGASNGWQPIEVDLQPFIDQGLDEVDLRWLVLTDDAVSESGMALAGLAIEQVTQQTRDASARMLIDFVSEGDSWRSIDPTLPQRWGLQAIVRTRDAVAVRRFEAGKDGKADIDLSGIPDDATVTLAISALTPGTRQPASYRLAPAP